MTNHRAQALSDTCLDTFLTTTTSLRGESLESLKTIIDNLHEKRERLERELMICRVQILAARSLANDKLPAILE